MNLLRLKSFFSLIDTLIYFNLIINKNSKKNELFFLLIDNFLLALFLEFFYILILYFTRNCYKIIYIYILLFLFIFFILYIINILFKPIKILYQ
jgi:hypothetical protein